MPQQQMYPRRYGDILPSTGEPDPPTPPTPAQLAIDAGLVVLDPDPWVWNVGRWRLRWAESRGAPRPTEGDGPIDAAYRYLAAWQAEGGWTRVSALFEPDSDEFGGGGEGAGAESPAARYEVWVHHPDQDVLATWAQARLGVAQWTELDAGSWVEARDPQDS